MASATASASASATASATASALDQQFIRDLTESIEKASKRSQCPYDNQHKACYRKNPVHFEECSHSIHYCEGDIKAYKPDTDRFLDNSFEIYNSNKRGEYQNFSQAWHTKISARTGDESTQFAQSDYSKHDSFYFLLLANIMTHLKEYVDKYGTKFLIFLLGTFESDDATGFYTLKKDSAIAQKLQTCGVREWWLLGNTTIKECVANPNKRKRTKSSEGRSSKGKGTSKGKGKGTSSGGKGTSRRKTHKSKRSKSKRSKSKRSKSKRSKSKRSKSKRSKSKRSKSKETKK